MPMPEGASGDDSLGQTMHIVERNHKETHEVVCQLAGGVDIVPYISAPKVYMCVRTGNDYVTNSFSIDFASEYCMIT